MLEDDQEVDQSELARLNALHRANGRPLANVLIEIGAIERGWLMTKISEGTGCELLAEWPTEFSRELIGLLTMEQARRYQVIPLRSSEAQIDVVAADPFGSDLADELAFIFGKSVHILFTEPEQVMGKIALHFREEAKWDEITEVETSNTTIDENALLPHDLEAMAGQPPVIRFVNQVLAQAVRDRASDLHFEPFEQEFKIRYRVDGTLRELKSPPRSLALPIASRIKVLANLNIAERRVPQDGRIKITLGGRAVDLRVSTLPTQFGESVVVRVLDQSSARLQISELGLAADVLAGVNEIIRRPHGIFVVTGPTGSGKTTTLYSGLNAINATGLKILTAEDPVEYEIEGLMQVPVNAGIGLTFAAVLRSFLRQDPDVIMIGEIRDAETAQIAVQAALTGHLVLSTLHTNDAAGAVTRLVDMGVEPFLIASTLEAVLAQRLLRRVCPECKTAVQPSESMVAQLNLTAAQRAEGKFFHGRGCAHCEQTGYKGRVGIYEWLPVSERLRELIVDRAPSLALRDRAISEGLRTLREDGLRAIFAGETTLEEVIKYT